MKRHPRPTANDEKIEQNWLIASSIQSTPSSAIDPDQLGVVRARRHPTGWFISSRVRDDLCETDRRLFDEFAALRVHALLISGPVASHWTPTGPDEWSETALACVDVEAAAQVPDGVPPHWSHAVSGSPAR